MPHAFLCEALVLKTYDVGEADRFCVLFTRERGRIAARAVSVRKLTSKLGGILLPFRRLRVGLHEGRSGFRIVSAVQETEEVPLTEIHAFTCAQQGTELLLSLVQHEGELPGLFEATAAFFSRCRTFAGRATVLAYSLQLLSFLGFFPANEKLAEMMELDADERRFLIGVVRGELTPLSEASVSKLERLCGLLSKEHLSSALKAPAVAAAMDDYA